MVSGGRGITVPQSGWYKIMSRVFLTSSNVAVGTSTILAIGSKAYLDIYVDGVIKSRSTQIVQQNFAAQDSAIAVSDIIYMQQDQTITVSVTAFAPTNSGQIYAWGFDATVDSPTAVSYLSAVFVSL
jgi:hypothetical protein